MKAACHWMLTSCLLGALLVATSHVSGADPESDKRILKVTVLDESGSPMAGANILRSVWTDDKEFNRTEKFKVNESGQASVTLPKSMTILRLWARKKGWPTLFANWGKSKVDDVPGELKLVVPHGTTIGGTIVNEAGQPISDARIELRMSGGGTPMNPGLPVSYTVGAHNIRTDASGRWTFVGIPPGDDVVLSMKVRHPDYIGDQYWGSLQEINGVTTRQLREQKARIVMESGHVIRGRVVDYRGEPVKGAVVSWSLRQLWSVGDRMIVTGDDGTYQIPPQPSGRLHVAVAAEDCKPQLVEIELTKETELRDFALDAGDVLRIRVVDVDFQPISDVNVVIDKWRGVQPLVRGSQNKLFESKLPRKTNDDGVFQWNSAPSDAVTIRLTKRGWSSLETDVVASESVQTLKLRRPVVISGPILDADSGDPIARANVFPVTYYPTRPDDPIVQRAQARAADGGQFSHTHYGGEAGEELMLQFEAEGYRPTRIGPFNENSESANIEIRLKKAPPLKGRVLDPDGAPLAGANVSFATKDSGLLVFSDWTYVREGLSTRTDSDGAFVFSATMHPPVLVATHESGYCEVALDLDQQPGDLRLLPWSSVVGRLTQAGEPVVGVNVSVRPIRMLGGDNPHVQDSFTVATDRDGRFAFARLPPLPSLLSPYLSVWQDCKLTSSQHVPLELTPGKMHTVNLGGEGIVVRGKVRPAGDLASSLDMNYCLNYLLKNAPGITPPIPIAQAGFDWRDGWSSDFRSSQEGRGFLKTLPHHFVKFEPDGTFAIHGVTAGDHQFAISIYEPPEGCLVDPVGLEVHRFNVGQQDLARGELDLGEIDVDVSLGPQIGEMFPDFRYDSVEDDEIQTITELKGRYVLVDFWATWCAPCVKMIPELKVLAGQVDPEKVTLLSVSLDEDADHARAFINEQQMDWPQAFLGARDNPLVRRQLGISSVPIYYLIDPSGRLIHRSFRLTDATDRLRIELAGEH